MKIKLNIEFDSVAEYEAFRTNTSIEEVRQKAKAAKVEVTAPKKEEPAHEFMNIPPDVDVPFEEDKPAPAAGHTEAELKLLLMSKSRDGKKDEVRAFLNSHGAKSFPDLISKGDIDIDALYSEAEGI